MSTLAVQKVTEQTFATDVLTSDLPVLLDFTAAWCPPCRALDPVLAALADQARGRLRVMAVDIDEQPGLAKRFAIRGAPTVVAFAGGKEIGRHLGVTTQQTLLKLVTPVE